MTSEVSGLYSWANDEGTFGVAVFGSFQERDSGSQHMSIEDWFPAVWGPNTASDWGMANANIVNEPTDGQTVNRPSNIGLGFNKDERERTNGQITLQFAPNDEMTLTVDASYAQNVQESVGLIDGLWHQATNYTDVVFDGNSEVAAPILLEEDVQGKDLFFQNLSQGVEDSLETFGVNFDWQVRDNLNLVFDAATAKAESGPDGAFGKNSVRVNIAGAVGGWRSWDYTGDIPQASVVIGEDRTSDPNGPNGIFDAPDVGSQVTQTYFSEQVTETEQFRVDGTWDLDEAITVQFGASYLGTEMSQEYEQGQLELGGWGIGSPGDIPEGLFGRECSGCEFDANLSGGTPADGNALPAGATPIALGSVSWGGDAVGLTRGLANVYGFTPGALPLTTKADNLIEEEVIAAFAQVDMDGEFAGMTTRLSLGLRYEYTDVESTTNQNVPESIIWESDNDFLQVLSADVESIKESSSYNNFLPSLDFSIDITDDVKARASFSQTLARPTYDKLFQSTSVNSPPRPSALGGVAGGSKGSVGLDPLESNNFDMSVEWYYGDANLFSVGYYRKDVQNFVGTAIVDQSLFGLRDAASGAAGSRSGDAAAALEAGGYDVTERNLFTMTAILDNPGAFPGGASDYEDTSTFADGVFFQYDVAPNGSDPLYTFGVGQPVNNETATIYGWEVAAQHWFGESGFGVQANYTTVEGDIEYDVGADPSEDQFALEGLSDSANLVLMYEKYGISARLLWNWRDDFLNQVQRSASGGNRNPEFIEEYEQVDLNVSYAINDNLSVSLDAINLTEEEVVHYGRSKNQVFFIQELSARYMLGLRYTY